MYLHEAYFQKKIWAHDRPACIIMGKSFRAPRLDLMRNMVRALNSVEYLQMYDFIAKKWGPKLSDKLPLCT